jgi:adenylylsulfate kinase
VKGLYHRALAGQLEHFSGISDPYEVPVHPDVYVNSGKQTPQESLGAILRKLEERGWLSATGVAAEPSIAL